MTIEQVFSASIRKHFAFLERDFGFFLVEDEFRQESATCVVRYKNNSRELALRWGRKDAQFYFGVYLVRPDGTTAPYADNSKELFYIFELGYCIDPKRDWVRALDIGESSPTEAVLDAAISRNAEVLRLHGAEILSGAKWFYEGD